MPDKKDQIETLTDQFLDLWQENIRRWANERELLTPSDMLDLLEQSSEEEGS